MTNFGSIEDIYKVLEKGHSALRASGPMGKTATKNFLRPE